MNSVKSIAIKNYAYYFFDDMINIKSVAPNKIKIDEVIQKRFLFATLDTSRSKT